MNRALLEFVRYVVAEKIRSKRLPKERGIPGVVEPTPAQRSSKFDIRAFKALGDLDDMLTYADRFLEEIAEGSSRRVYVLSARKVLKIAAGKKRAGIAQNAAEADASTHPGVNKVVAKVLDADKDHLWLISELVRPLGSKQEFKKLTGFSLQAFQAAIDAKFQGSSKPGAGDWPTGPSTLSFDSGSMDDQLDDFERAESSDMVASVVAFIEATGAAPGDIKKLDSWGQNPTGNVVLLDYGATNGIMDRFYQND